MTAKNSKDIKDVDARAQAGIQAVNAKTTEVDQESADRRAERSSGTTDGGRSDGRVGVLTNTVANLDNYRPVAETSVKFGFNRDNLTQQAKDSLDQMAGNISSTKGYIITLEGSTDSVGSAEYNYDLSQRRANSVIQYLASKYNVPAHKIYVIGLGKDKPVETNKTKQGRAGNRRVDVRLMRIRWAIRINQRPPRRLGRIIRRRCNKSVNKSVCLPPRETSPTRPLNFPLSGLFFARARKDGWVVS